MGIRQEALKLVLNKKIKKLSETKYLVKNKYLVWFKTKLGRTEIYCNCENGTKFCNSPTICKHKLAVIHYIQMQEFYKFLKKNK